MPPKKKTAAKTKQPSTHQGAITLAGEAATIYALMTQGEDNHWQIGVHYNNIVDNKLAEKAGYPTARDFFKRDGKAPAQSTLTLYGSVAKSFSEASAKQYGCTKLGLLLTYESLAHAAAVGGDPGQALVHVPQKDGTIADKLLKACSVGDLSKAIKHLKGGASPLPAPDAAQVQKLQAALASALGPHGHASLAAKVRGRKTVLSLDGVALDQLATVLDALRSA